jgi:hypothetical protein
LKIRTLQQCEVLFVFWSVVLECLFRFVYQKFGSHF